MRQNLYFRPRVGSAAISYIEKGPTWHLWPLHTSPSCASVTLALLHPTHSVASSGNLQPNSYKM